MSWRFASCLPSLEDDPRSGRLEGVRPEGRVSAAHQDRRRGHGPGPTARCGQSRSEPSFRPRRSQIAIASAEPPEARRGGRGRRGLEQMREPRDRPRDEEIEARLIRQAERHGPTPHGGRKVTAHESIIDPRPGTLFAQRGLRLVPLGWDRSQGLGRGEAGRVGVAFRMALSGRDVQGRARCCPTRPVARPRLSRGRCSGSRISASRAYGESPWDSAATWAAMVGLSPSGTSSARAQMQRRRMNQARALDHRDLAAVLLVFDRRAEIAIFAVGDQRVGIGVVEHPPVARGKASERQEVDPFRAWPSAVSARAAANSMGALMPVPA